MERKKDAHVHSYHLLACCHGFDQGKGKEKKKESWGKKHSLMSCKKGRGGRQRCLNVFLVS